MIDPSRGYLQRELNPCVYACFCGIDRLNLWIGAHHRLSRVTTLETLMDHVPESFTCVCLNILKKTKKHTHQSEDDQSVPSDRPSALGDESWIKSSSSLVS